MGHREAGKMTRANFTSLIGTTRQTLSVTPLWYLSVPRVVLTCTHWGSILTVLSGTLGALMELPNKQASWVAFGSAREHAMFLSSMNEKFLSILFTCQNSMSLVLKRIAAITTRSGRFTIFA